MRSLFRSVVLVAGTLLFFAAVATFLDQPREAATDGLVEIPAHCPACKRIRWVPRGQRLLTCECGQTVDVVDDAVRSPE